MSTSRSSRPRKANPTMAKPPSSEQWLPTKLALLMHSSRESLPSSSKKEPLLPSETERSKSSRDTSPSKSTSSAESLPRLFKSKPTPKKIFLTDRSKKEKEKGDPEARKVKTDLEDPERKEIDLPEDLEKKEIDLPEDPEKTTRKDLPEDPERKEIDLPEDLEKTTRKDPEDPEKIMKIDPLEDLERIMKKDPADPEKTGKEKILEKEETSVREEDPEKAKKEDREDLPSSGLRSAPLSPQMKTSTSLPRYCFCNVGRLSRKCWQKS